jgi:tetratricopeptide (TPR) repeat protein
LKETFSVPGYPTFVLTNAKGETIFRWIGYEKDFFIESIQTGMSDLSTIVEKLARFQNKPDEATANIIANFHDSKGEYKEAATFYKKAADLSINHEKDYSMSIFWAQYYGMRKELFTIDELKQAANSALNSDAASDEDKNYVLYYMCRFIPDNKNDAELLDYLKKAEAKMGEAGENTNKRISDQINISYALFIEKNAKKAIELKKTSLPEGWEDEARQLNGFSWWCFENEINLEEAEKLALKGVELAEPGNEKAQILDTLAEIQNLLGKTEEAIKTLKLAVKEAPDTEYYSKQLARFEKRIKTQ